eukprot:SRR837773.5029.p1 GENE.SRR837773.5029~~SRR837773.5029.p1  ORF type:complete len:254 (-),score=61.32 SRR837773.5029:58-819(-)
MVRLGGLVGILLAVGASAVDDEVVLAGLAADEVCEAGSDCTLELRQLRARQQLAVAVEGEGEPAQADDDGEEAEEVEPALLQAGDFGPDAQGVNMWQEQTWGDVLGAIQANASDSGYGCETTTGGTCSMFSCKASRGATRCVSGLCKCAPGYCAKSGTCFPSTPAACLADTGGTCSVTGCRSSRGPTKCEQGRCLCTTGNCAWNGRCFPVTDTGGTCSYFGCDKSRGQTTCHKGRCICQMNFVAVDGRCVSLK